MLNIILKNNKVTKIVEWLWYLMPFLLIINFSRSFLEGVVIISSFYIVFNYFGFGKIQLNETLILLLISLGFFVVLTGLSQIVTPDFWQGLDQIRSFHLKLLIVVGLFIIFFRKGKNKKYFIYGMLVALLAAIIWGGFEWFFGSEALPWGRASSWPEAITPFGDHKNKFGTYLAWMIPVSLSFAFYCLKEYSFKCLRFWFSLILSFAGIGVLILSLARGAQVGTIVGCSFVAMVFLLKKFEFKTFVLLFLVCAIFTGIILMAGQEYIEDRWIGERSVRTLSGRYTTIWPAVLEAVSERVWFGYDMSRESYSKYVGPGAHEHSFYLHFLFSTGIVGLVSYVLLLATMVFVSLKNIIKEKSSFHFWVFVGLFAGFFSSVIVNGLVTNPYFLFLEINIAVIISLNVWSSSRFEFFAE